MKRKLLMIGLLLIVAFTMVACKHPHDMEKQDENMVVTENNDIDENETDDEEQEKENPDSLFEVFEQN